VTAIRAQRVAMFGISEISLWHGNDGISMHSTMIDVAERSEVGCLEFSVAISPPGNLELPVADLFRHPFTVTKLIARIGAVEVESGLVFEGVGEPVVVVAGAMPYSLAIAGLATGEPFTPEFPLQDYTREPML
jgi:hypothetical protein